MEEEKRRAKGMREREVEEGRGRKKRGVGRRGGRLENDSIACRECVVFSLNKLMDGQTGLLATTGGQTDRHAIFTVELLFATKYLVKSEEQGHRHKSRALVRENVKTCENL